MATSYGVEDVKRLKRCKRVQLSPGSFPQVYPDHLHGLRWDGAREYSLRRQFRTTSAETAVDAGRTEPPDAGGRFLFRRRDERSGMEQVGIYFEGVTSSIGDGTGTSSIVELPVDACPS